MSLPRVGIFVDMLSAFGREVLNGINAYVRSHDPWLIFGDPERIVAPLQDIAHWGGDGVIAQAWTPELREQLRHLNVPSVNVSHHRSDEIVSSVLADSLQIGALAARHLLERGFRQFGYCGFTGHRYSELRAEGFLAELQRHDCTCEVFDGVPPQAEPEQWDRRQAELAAWVGALRRPAGVMCCNDVRARHVAQVCLNIGVRVPEEMALVGVDNDRLVCEMSDPPLSSVNVAADQVGYEAAALLSRLMAGRPAPATPLLIAPRGIIARRSTDVLAIDDPIVAQAVRFIRDHAAEPISVDDVVAAVPLSRRVLERRFRKFLNRTAGDEIGHARIDRAKQLLTQSDTAIPEVARRSGFNYVQQFNTMFKKFTGLTPTTYRRQFRLR
jgi:LacI family transcriptional regulator